MKKLKKIYVEITNVCNLSCPFCHKTKRDKRFMSEREFREVIQRIKPYTDFIYLHVMGEPLLHRKLDLFLDICEEFGIKANITTNGVLIDRWSEVLSEKRSLRQINFSLHSFEVNLCPKSREQYLNDIISFVSRAQQKGIYSCFRLWNLKEGREDKNLFVLEALERAFRLPKPLEAGLIPGNGMTLAPYVYLQQEREFIWPDRNGEDRFLSGGCFALRDHIGILADGTVVPCCLDSEGDLAIGNLFETDLGDILASPRAAGMKEGFQKKQVVESFCRSCGWTLKK